MRTFLHSVLEHSLRLCRISCAYRRHDFPLELSYTYTVSNGTHLP
jgi:hypothetical protein